VEKWRLLPASCEFPGDALQQAAKVQAKVARHGLRWKVHYLALLEQDMGILRFYLVVDRRPPLPDAQPDAVGTGTVRSSGNFDVVITERSVKQGRVYQIRHGIDHFGDYYNCKSTSDHGTKGTFAKIDTAALGLMTADEEPFGEEIAAEADSNYSVSITMNQDTVNDLTAGGYQLYAFKAVQITRKDGAPLVWFASNAYGLDTRVSWTKRYAAYTSRSQIVPDGTIIATNSYPIALGQTLNVTEPTGVGKVTTNGVPQAISILNTTTTRFTCGISQTNPDGSTNPMCAFPLHGGGRDLFAPIEQVLLLFSTLPVNTGTVIFQAYSRGLFIDLTQDNTQAVEFDIDQGWSWDGGPWAQVVEAGADLVPFLIQRPSSAFTRHMVSV
jgi:hypothetical protein